MRVDDGGKSVVKMGIVLSILAIGGAALAATPTLVPIFRAVGGLVLFGIVLSLMVSRFRPGNRMTSGDHDGETASDDGASVEITTTIVETGDPQRRAAIKMVGLGVLGAVPLMGASGVIDRFVGGAGSLNDGASALSGTRLPANGFTQAGPAATKDGRIRQWTMIMDLRYCDGCQSQGTPPQCTTACIEGRYVPQPMEWIELYENDLPGGGTQFLPTLCMQCQNPPCVNVCPVGATFSSPEGTVLIDQDRCIGCRLCMAACPYDRRFFLWGDPPVPPESLLADYSPDHQAPAQRGTVYKCDFCPDMVRAGTLPFCIQACPNDAIWYGDLEEDIATNGKQIVTASRFMSENSAYRLKENLGTEPRVYFIPGHGELVGRDPYTPGRQPTEWPWVERAEGSTTWSR
ncbi:MAG: 4Fe-4S dicluster domain-containing protein [Acidimicrobiia bacterium]